MSTDPTVLANVMYGIENVLVNVLDIAGTNPLFGSTVPTSSACRVFGIRKPVADMGGAAPYAVVNFNDETDATETTGKQQQELPFAVRVVFDNDDGSEPDGDNLRERHTNLIRLVKDAFLQEANRQLPLSGSPSAEDTRYVGGGARLEIIDVDADDDTFVPKTPARFSFELRFAARYRHEPTDSTQIT